MEIEISDPGEGGKQVVVPTRKKRGERLKSSMLVVEERSRSKREGFKFDEEPGRSGFGEEAKIFFASISRGEKTAMDKGEDVQCNEDVILEERERESVSRTESGGTEVKDSR